MRGASWASRRAGAIETDALFPGPPLAPATGRSSRLREVNDRVRVHRVGLPVRRPSSSGGGRRGHACTRGASAYSGAPHGVDEGDRGRRRRQNCARQEQQHGLAGRLSCSASVRAVATRP
jgi:hypothetical protein